MRQDRSRHRRAGVTLVELAVALGVIAVIIALSVPAMSRMAARQRGREGARLVSGAFSLARSEAIRTGNVHLVFFQVDAAGAALADAGGNPVDLLILDDGRPGSAGHNCRIDAGEPIVTVDLPVGVAPGLGAAGGPVPSDLAGGGVAVGSSFRDPANNPAQWVMFRPEGMPLSFDLACTMGPVGSGAGGIYLMGGDRSFATVLLPLGGTRVHAWEQGAGQWTN